MNQKYVPKLETCQRMKELGYPQESEWYWRKAYGETYFLMEYRNNRGQANFNRSKKDISAPHVGELGLCFPNNVQLPFISRHPDRLGWLWSTSEGRKLEDAEAEARAKMWIYLKENNLI